MSKNSSELFSAPKIPPTPVNQPGKVLSGREIAGFVKERQANFVRTLRSKNIYPTLLILRDSDNPVIEKYVSLKKSYGADIGVKVLDELASSRADLEAEIASANNDSKISGLIVQLPLSPETLGPAKDRTSEKAALSEILEKIAPEKDLDGLSGKGSFDSATATAINWLLSSYDVDLKGKKIAIVGRGLLVGAPLYRIFSNSGLSPDLFHRGSNLMDLKNYDVIITATGHPGLITSEMLKPGAIVVDAGTASENGILKGDLAESVRTSRPDLSLTPRIGGVGPLTISVLFENLLTAAQS